MSIVKLGRQIENQIHRVSRVMNMVGIIVLFLMMLIQTTDVVGRYVFNAPLKVSMDYIELGMGILVFWGLAYCASVNEHIQVDLILIRLPKHTRETIERIVFGAGAFTLALITWRLAYRAWTIIHNPPGPVTLTMLVPYWPFIILASIGCLFYCLECLIRVFNPSSGRQEVSPTATASPEKTHEGSLSG